MYDNITYYKFVLHVGSYADLNDMMNVLVDEVSFRTDAFLSP